jgi:hypothetical protein
MVSYYAKKVQKKRTERLLEFTWLKIAIFLFVILLVMVLFNAVISEAPSPNCIPNNYLFFPAIVAYGLIGLVAIFLLIPLVIASTFKIGGPVGFSFFFIEGLYLYIISAFLSERFLKDENKAKTFSIITAVILMLIIIASFLKTSVKCG